MKKRNIPLVLIVISIILIFPIFLECLINSINIPTGFQSKDWFAFWGSYLGTIVSLFIFWLTITENKKNTEARLDEFEKKQNYENQINRISHIYSEISLKKYRLMGAIDNYKLGGVLKYDFLDLRLEINLIGESEYKNMLKSIVDQYEVIIGEMINIDNGGYFTVEYTAKLFEDMQNIFENAREELSEYELNYKNNLKEVIFKNS